MDLLGKAKAGLMAVTLEPVFFLFCVNLGLVMISNQDLYLAKVRQGSSPMSSYKDEGLALSRMGF